MPCNLVFPSCMLFKVDWMYSYNYFLFSLWKVVPVLVRTIPHANIKAQLRLVREKVSWLAELENSKVNLASDVIGWGTQSWRVIPPLFSFFLCLLHFLVRLLPYSGKQEPAQKMASENFRCALFLIKTIFTPCPETKVSKLTAYCLATCTWAGTMAKTVLGTFWLDRRNQSDNLLYDTMAEWLLSFDWVGKVILSIKKS